MPRTSIQTPKYEVKIPVGMPKYYAKCFPGTGVCCIENWLAKTLPSLG
jgi:hypothetical protein